MIKKPVLENILFSDWLNHFISTPFKLKALSPLPRGFQPRSENVLL